MNRAKKILLTLFTCTIAIMIVLITFKINEFNRNNEKEKNTVTKTKHKEIVKKDELVIPSLTKTKDVNVDVDQDSLLGPNADLAKLSGTSVYNLTDDEFIGGKDPNRLLYPASCSKILTNYILWDYIKKGKIKLTDHIKTSPDIDKIAAKWNGPVPEVNKSMTVKEVTTASLINSSNDATMSIANLISGDESKFALLMEDYMKNHFKFKKEDYHFYTSAGLGYTDFQRAGAKLRHKITPTNLLSQNQVTARELTIIFARLIKEHPQVRDIIKQEYIVAANGFEYDATWAQYWRNLVDWNYFRGGKSGAHPFAHPEGGWGYSYVGLFNRNGKDYVITALDSHDEKAPLRFENNYIKKIKDRSKQFDVNEILKDTNILDKKVYAKNNKVKLNISGNKKVSFKIDIPRKKINKKDAENISIGHINVIQGNRTVKKIDLYMR